MENIIRFRDEYGTNCDSLEKIEKFLNKGIDGNKIILSFDDVEFKIKDFNFTEILKKTLTFENQCFLPYQLIFTFNNSTFHSNVTFNNLICKRLIFDKAIFNYGATIKKSKFKAIYYYPKELNSDVIFDDCEISFFKYKNQLKGDGFTRFYSVDFKIKADFRKSILDNVHFQNQKMKNIYLLNSKVDKTLFENCKFKNKVDIYPHHTMYKFKVILVASIPNFILLYIPLFKYVAYLYFILFSFHFLNELIIIIINFITNKINLFLTGETPKFRGYLSIADDKIIKDEDDINKLKSIYEQMSINFINKKNYINAIDFNYNYRYLNGIFYIKTNQSFLDNMIITPLHHFINSFGTNWFKPLLWFFITVFIIAKITTPNKDYISTKSTPPFLLTAYNDNSIIDFNQSAITSNELNKTAHFLLIAKTNYKNIEDKNKTTIYAYDNRFDFKFNEQYIPMLKNDFTTKLYYSFSNIVAPFTPDNKKWFTNRTSKAVKLSILETILLWFFFGAFVLAIKNRIRR